MEKDGRDGEILEYYAKFGFKEIYNCSQNIIVGRI